MGEQPDRGIWIVKVVLTAGPWSLGGRIAPVAYMRK